MSRKQFTAALSGFLPCLPCILIQPTNCHKPTRLFDLCPKTIIPQRPNTHVRSYTRLHART